MSRRPGNLAGYVLHHLATVAVGTEHPWCPGEPAPFQVPQQGVH
jgi:hypothetical protein